MLPTSVLTYTFPIAMFQKLILIVLNKVTNTFQWFKHVGILSGVGWGLQLTKNFGDFDKKNT